jgi:hypothetical protein
MFRRRGIRLADKTMQEWSRANQRIKKPPDLDPEALV